MLSCVCQKVSDFQSVSYHLHIKIRRQLAKICENAVPKGMCSLLDLEGHNIPKLWLKHSNGFYSQSLAGFVYCVFPTSFPTSSPSVLGERPSLLRLIEHFLGISARVSYKMSDPDLCPDLCNKLGKKRALASSLNHERVTWRSQGNFPFHTK